MLWRTSVKLLSVASIVVAHAGDQESPPVTAQSLRRYVRDGEAVCNAYGSAWLARAALLAAQKQWDA